MKEQELVDKVIKLYKAYGVVRDVSRQLGITTQTARRILIYAGEYTNDTYERVTALYEKGMSPEKIASLLGLSHSCVNSYLPYSRKLYGVDDCSHNAEVLRRWREKHKKC